MLIQQTGHILGSDAFGSGFGLAVLEQLAPLALLDVAEHGLAEELAPGASLLFHDLVDPVRQCGREGEGDGAGGSGHGGLLLPGLTAMVRDGVGWFQVLAAPLR